MSEIAGIDPSVPPSGEGCVECEAAGGWWVHLRRCAQCGHIGCCDTSPMQHATAHASATGHPFIRSFEPGEDWFYSYETKETYDGPELAPPQHHPVDQGVPGPKGRVPSGLAPARALLGLLSDTLSWHLPSESVRGVGQTHVPEVVAG